MTPARGCLPLVSLFLPVSAVGCDAGPTCLPVSPSPVLSPTSAVSCLCPCACGQLQDAVTLAPGSCLPLVSLCLAISGVVSPACLSPTLCGQMPDAPSAGSGVARSLCDAMTLAPGSPAFPPISPILCGQMPDAVSQSCLVSHQCRFLLVFLSLRSDARCCDAGSGVVSRACLPVSRSLCDVVTLWGRVCPLISIKSSTTQAQLRSIKSSPARNIDSKSEGTTCKNV